MFVSFEFDEFAEREPHSWNGETYYNCNECTDFKTSSQRLLDEHVKYFHAGFYINPDSVLNQPYTEPHYLHNKYPHTNIFNGHFDLNLVKHETLDDADVDGLLGFNIKEEWFDGFEQDMKLDNVIIHKDVFECKICDEVFVCKQKYLNHLGSKLHIFNEISKNNVSPANSCSGNSDDEEDDVNQVSLHGKNATHGKNANGFSKDVKIKMENIDHSSKSKVNNGSSDSIDYKSYMDEENLKCKLCNYQTTQLKGLRTHILMHIERSHTCEICGFQAHFKSTLYEHYNSLHKGVQMSCDDCDFTTISYRSYLKHKVDHSNTEYCDLCNKNIFGQNKIYFHYFKKHKGYEFKCKLCPYVTKNPKSFIAHKDDGHYRRQCDSCDFVASNKTKFVEHLKKGCTQSEAPRIKAKIEVMSVNTERELRSKVMVDNYSCNICKRYFKTHSLLEDHMNIFHCFPCEECDYIAFSIKSLTTHEMSHKTKNKTTAKASPLLGSIKSLTTHKMSHKIQNKTTSKGSSLLGGFCKFCSRRLPPNMGMKRHIAFRHSGDKPYTCPMPNCGLTFENSTTMTAHIQSVHAQSLPYECNLCPHRYADRTGVQKHMSRVHSSLKCQNTLSCTKCSYQAPNRKSLSSHMRVHCLKWINYSENSSKYDRKVENTSTDEKMESTSNERKVENSLSTLYCTKCTYQSLSRKSLNSHMRVHSLKWKYYSGNSPNNRKGKNTSINGKMENTSNEKEGKNVLSCTMCSYQTSVRNSLSTHMKVHLKRKYRIKNISNDGKVENTSEMDFVKSEAGEPDLTCSKCERVFLNKKTWQRHLNFHKMNRKIVCKDCGFRFKLKIHKDNHQHYHRSSNKYVCDLCNLRFSRSVSHKNHMESHRNFAYFDCAICDFRTSSRDSLNMHTMIHADEMKYSCKLCDYKCESQALYLKHLKEHKTENSRKKNAASAQSSQRNAWYKCSTCDECFVTLNSLFKHSLDVHSNRPSIKHCACGKQFSLSGNLTRHIRTHIQTNNSTHEQSVSSMSPIIMLSPVKPKPLKRPKIPFEDVEWPFKCVICDKEFKTINLLKYHMETTHNSNTYKCRECNFVTNKPSHLSTHLPVHTSYLKCKQCNTQLSNYQHKIRHIEQNCKGIRY
uniref:Zinc finger protein 208 n=1 Tax=Cacopsylla melanoneura TaxID=428564 RepID=A0A8D9BLV2_9HEMI